MDVAATPDGRMCHRCGKDLTGQVRYRDESGYWCAPCSKAERRAYRASHLPCDDCGQDVRRGQEIVLQDRRLCDVCCQKRQVQAVRERMAAQADARRRERVRRRWRAARNWSLVVAELVVAGALIRFLSLSRPDPTAGPPPSASSSSAPAVCGQAGGPSPPAAAP